eukprot:1577051-Ditylum_brightwellii.AAC.1
MSVYQVCQNNKKSGTTAFHQHQAILKQQKSPTTNPRKQFICNLKQFIAAGGQKGEEFIIGGDFNEVISPESLLSTLCSINQAPLIDALGSIQGEKYSTSLT